MFAPTPSFSSRSDTLRRGRRPPVNRAGRPRGVFGSTPGSFTGGDASFSLRLVPRVETSTRAPLHWRYPVYLPLRPCELAYSLFILLFILRPSRNKLNWPNIRPQFFSLSPLFDRDARRPLELKGRKQRRRE